MRGRRFHLVHVEAVLGCWDLRNVEVKAVGSCSGVGLCNRSAFCRFPCVDGQEKVGHGLEQTACLRWPKCSLQWPELGTTSFMPRYVETRSRNPLLRHVSCSYDVSIKVNRACSQASKASSLNASRSSIGPLRQGSLKLDEFSKSSMTVACNPWLQAMRAFQSLAFCECSSGVAGSYMTRAAKSEASLSWPSK